MIIIAHPLGLRGSFGSFATALLAPIVLFVGAALTASPAQAQGAGQSPQVFDFEDTLVAYEDYPFPFVPEGELWIPDLSRQTVTAFVPVDLIDARSQEVRDVPSQADALWQNNQGQQAIDLLAQNRARLPKGKADMEIGAIYYLGRGGIPVDKPKAIAFYEAAALHMPEIYEWLGNNKGNLQDKLRTWSIGLSRGCQPCARALVRATNKPLSYVDMGNEAFVAANAALPQELRLAYAMVAVDLGAQDSLAMLTTLIRTQKERPLPVSPQGAALFDQLMQEMLEAVNGDFGLARTQTVAAPVYRRIRTGLVDGRLQLAAMAMDRKDWRRAADLLAFNDTGGRYFPQAANSFMTRVPREPVILGRAAVSHLAIKATGWGDAQHAAAAALIYSQGLPFYRYYNSKWQIDTMKSPESGREFRALAASSGQLPREVAEQIPTFNGQTLPTEAAALARSCLAKAQRTGVLEDAMACRSNVYRAWQGTREVDFGVLSDQFFAGLSSKATQAYQAEYDRRANAAADGITRGALQRANPNAEISNAQVVAGRSQVDGLAQWDRQKFRNITSYYDDVRDWRQAYQRRRTSVASESVSAAAPALARSPACALWSFEVLPLCE